MYDPDCIFCKIAAGEIPCGKLYEDDDIIAFMDINPISDGHTLVIPKTHSARVHDSAPDVLAKLAAKLPMLANAVVKGLECSGYNILCNNGAAAGQEVEHVHFHIIPRNPADGVFNRWPKYQYPEGRSEELLEKIKSQLTA
jgi:histidine triad (HIT) family protein